MAKILPLPQDGEPAAATPPRIRDFATEPLNYRVVAKGDAADIYLYDSIGSFFGISAKQFAADLKALGSVKTVNLRVNSDGGDVFDGRAIFTQLAQHPARVIAHVDGLAASIASLIVMAADEIRMAEGAFVMIHNAWGVALGNADEMRRYALLLDSVDQTLVDSYVKRTKNSADDIRAWMAAETWMDGADAVAKGFADVLDESVKVAASVREPAKFRNLPAALRTNRAAALSAIERMKSAAKLRG